MLPSEGRRNMEMERLLWNVKEAGLALGLSPWTIRRYISDGKLQTVRLGRRVLIEPVECRRLINEGRTKPPVDEDGPA
jgi:excisionase family DNA binding protein